MALRTSSQILLESMEKMKELFNKSEAFNSEEDSVYKIVYNTAIDSVILIIKDMSIPHELEDIKWIYEKSKKNLKEGIDINGDEFLKMWYGIETKK